MFSHRWQGQEPSHEDVTKAGSVYSLDPKDNAAKLQDFCCTAAKCGFRWAWSDTCCINKRSDAETSESINSMFKWYRHSALTIVYLHDDGELDGRTLPDWCLRGWTLQEMLAPSFLRFYSKDWTLLEKAYDPLDQHGVLQINAEKRSTRATGIDKEMLAGFKAGTDNVREKLHWAAKRETTKVEDRAYSLLGVFDINMPVIYGEGDRAFIRLQEEIMKRTNDLTLFDWSGASS
ncbi:hypothetical protein HYDPIDRAFT_82704, partial [Hydnomerulius pinastri MD-312]